jgi:cullin 3
LQSQGKIKTRELNVSTYAMVILLLFNDLSPGQSLDFEEIQGKTNIPTNELIRNLQSLAVAPKTRVLIKEPMSKDIKPTDKFLFNESFYFTTRSKSASSPPATGSKPMTNGKTEKKNNDTRGGIIEAAVVRIMYVPSSSLLSFRYSDLALTWTRQRKGIHQQLLTEVITQLTSLPPGRQHGQKRIEA